MMHTPMFYFTALMMLCSAVANNVIPYTSLRRIPFVPSGDSSAETGESPADHRLLIGVLDLRPTLDQDSIIVLKGSSENSSDNAFEVVQQARFPVLKDGNSAIENEMDKHAASSHRIGNLCSTVYLVIEYDFDNGKTVLHRSFGGAKLLAFIDGVRSRWHELSQINKSDESAATKLTLLLVPTSTSQSSNALKHIVFSNRSNSHLNTIALELEETGDTDWDASGVRFLIRRLSEAFALGGQEFQNVEPFAVQVGIFDAGQEKKEAGLSDIIARCIRRTKTSPPSADCCSAEISNANENADGVGN